MYVDDPINKDGGYILREDSEEITADYAESFRDVKRLYKPFDAEYADKGFEIWTIQQGSEDSEKTWIGPYYPENFLEGSEKHIDYVDLMGMSEVRIHLNYDLTPAPAHRSTVVITKELKGTDATFSDEALANLSITLTAADHSQKVLTLKNADSKTDTTAVWTVKEVPEGTYTVSEKGATINDLDPVLTVKVGDKTVQDGSITVNGEETTKVLLTNDYSNVKSVPVTVEHYFGQEKALVLTENETISAVDGVVTADLLSDHAGDYKLAMAVTRQNDTDSKLTHSPAPNFYFLYKHANAVQDEKTGTWTLKLYYNSVRFFVNTNGIPGGAKGHFINGIYGTVQENGEDFELAQAFTGDKNRIQYRGDSETFRANIEVGENRVTLDPMNLDARVSYDKEKQHILWYSLHEGVFVHVDGIIVDNEAPNITYHANYEGAETASKDFQATTLTSGVYYFHSILDYDSTALSTRQGYTFQGWSTTPDRPVQYEPGAEIDVASHVNLYAQWKATTGYSLTVKYEFANGASFDGYEAQLLGGNYTYDQPYEVTAKAPPQDYELVAVNGSTENVSATVKGAIRGNTEIVFTFNKKDTGAVIVNYLLRDGTVLQAQTTRSVNVGDAYDVSGIIPATLGDHAQYKHESTEGAVTGAISEKGQTVIINVYYAPESYSYEVVYRNAHTGAEIAAVSNADMKAPYGTKLTADMVAKALGADWLTAKLPGENGYYFSNVSYPDSIGVGKNRIIVTYDFTESVDPGPGPGPGPNPDPDDGRGDDDRPDRPDRPDNGDNGNDDVIDVPENNVPQGDLPADVVPGGQPENGGDELIDMGEPETPLADQPGDGSDDEITIVDDQVPLGNLPQTGTAAQAADPTTTLGLLALSLSMAAAGLAFSVSRKKEEEN